MKNVKLIFITVILLFCLSCTEKYAEEQPQTKVLQLNDEQMAVLRSMRNDNNEVSQDEVLAYVNDVITVLDGEVALRSGQSRRIGAIAALTMDNTKQSIALKSGGEIVIETPDTVAYVVNFADSAGFAIIAADTRIPVSVLAYVADRTLGLNPGAAAAFPAVILPNFWTTV